MIGRKEASLAGRPFPCDTLTYSGGQLLMEPAARPARGTAGLHARLQQGPAQLNTQSHPYRWPNQGRVELICTSYVAA
eukprot:1159226-Pelagomonas_calceolata.AAC.5